MTEASSRTPMETVRAVYASHEKHDTPGLAELLHPKVEWYQAESHPYASETPWRGPHDVVAHVANPVNDEWEGFATQVDEYIEAGNQVIVLGRYRGTYRATGKRIDAQMCAIYTVVDGMIVKWQQYTDTYQIRGAAGADRGQDS